MLYPYGPMLVHIHQGGTLRAYCGLGMHLAGQFVAWEDASKATCPGCVEAFRPVAAATAGHR